MNSIVCMDNTILKIVQIFVFVPHLLLMNMNSACARFNPRLSLLRQGKKVYQLDDYLALELSLSWSKSTQWYSQCSR